MKPRAILLAGILSSGGCVNPPCTALPTSLQLNIEVDDDDPFEDIFAIEVVLNVGNQGWQRRFDVENTLSDRITSLAVELQPEPVNEDSIQIDLSGFGAMEANGQDGPLIFSISDTFDLSPDGCNEYFMELKPVDP